jgi:hypothetical protein
MRLFDASLADIEQGAARSALTPTGHDPFYDVDPEVLAAWREAEAYTASLVDPTVWVDADLVTSGDVREVAA